VRLTYHGMFSSCGDATGGIENCYISYTPNFQAFSIFQKIDPSFPIRCELTRISIMVTTLNLLLPSHVSRITRKKNSCIACGVRICPAGTFSSSLNILKHLFVILFSTLHFTPGLESWTGY